MRSSSANVEAKPAPPADTWQGMKPFQILLNPKPRVNVIRGRSGRRKVAVSEEVHRPFAAPVAGRHDRLPGIAGLGRACLTTLVALVAQFGLGMWLNLYVRGPGLRSARRDRAGDHERPVDADHSCLARHIPDRRRDRPADPGGPHPGPRAAALTAAGLGAILGAFAAGELFVRNGTSSASLWMAVLTGIALLCYISVQARVSTARLTRARTRAEDPPFPCRAAHILTRGPRAPAAPPQQPPWPPTRGPIAPRPLTYEPPISGPQPAHRTTAPGSRPMPAYRSQYGYPATPADMSGPQPSYRPADPGAGPQPSYPLAGPGTGPQPSYPLAGPGTGPQPSYPLAGPGTGPQPSYPLAGPGTGPEPSYPLADPGTGPQPSYPLAGPGARPRNDPPYRGRRRAAPRPDPRLRVPGLPSGMTASRRFTRCSLRRFPEPRCLPRHSSWPFS